MGLRPVGAEPSAVYWRRRVVFVATLAVVLALVVLTFRVFFSGGGSPQAGAGTSGAASTTSTSVSSPATARGSSPRKASTSSRAGKTSENPTSGKSTSGKTASGKTRSSRVPAPPKPCVRAQLTVQAATSKPSYPVGAKPTLMLKVTNPGPAACVQDLADKQVVLSVYNGESRVWGSHDCEIQAGTDPQTLAAKTPVLVSVIWSGLSSTTNCTGTRQRVGAGSYTLFASLAGRNGSAAQFSIN